MDAQRGMALGLAGGGAAILYGLAPSSDPGRYFVMRHDAVNPRREGIFEKLADGTWSRLEGDTLEPEASNVRFGRDARLAA